MSIELHREAVSNFNEKAKLLIALVKETPHHTKSSEPSTTNFFVDTKITEKDIIGEIEVGFVDLQGNESGKLFQYGTKNYGLVGNDYLEFIKLANAIQEVEELVNLVSIEFVKNCLFRWVKENFPDVNRKEFVSYLLEAASLAIKEFEIWIPIPFTSLQNEFEIGRIVLKPITANKISEWFSYQHASRTTEALEHIHQYELKFRKKYQGYAAAVFNVEAESERAQELAYYEVNKTLGIIRLLSPANRIPELISGAYEYGQNMVETKNYLTINEEEKVFIETNQMLDKGLLWKINSFEINLLERGELSKCNKLLREESQNDYQKKLLEALLIYSKSTLRRDLYDKVLYILASLESMLLRNESEPIQQNVGDRIAFTIGGTADERKKIVAKFKEIYAIRSKFLHHGYTKKDDIALIRELLRYAWLTFSSLIQNINNFNTKEDCISAIEKVKYS